MRARLLYFRHLLNSSFWFLPGVMIAAALVLSFVTLAFDARFPELPALVPFAPTGPEGARLVLSTVAGSMITVASLVFSITLVTLSVAAQQLGPRLITVFMSDRLYQLVLGSFLALFVYTLFVLRAVQAGGAPFVPSLSVGLVLAGTVVNVFILVAYVHNAAGSVQADRIVAQLARSATAAVQQLPLLETTPDGEDPADEEWAHSEGVRAAVVSEASGYVQAIDAPCLVALAEEHDVRIVLHVHPGAFVVDRTPLAVVVAPRGRLDQALFERVRGAVALGSQRTPTQDLVYGVQGLVEIALRALSPGINDPFTAVTCIDYLSATLAAAMERQLPARYLRDSRGVARVERPAPTYCCLFERAFADIRMAAPGLPLVLEHLALRLETLAHLVCTPEQRRAVERETAGLMRAARDDAIDARVRARIEERVERIAAAVGARLPEGTVRTSERFGSDNER